MSNVATTIKPPAGLDYSLTGVNASLAIEKGLAEADWYTSPVPRQKMRQLLERRNGPAIRDTIRSPVSSSSLPSRLPSSAGS